MQVLERDIMHDVIVSALEESGVDIAVGQHTCLRQTGTESDGMSFSDTDIKDTVRQLFLHDTHRAPGRHSRGDTYNLVVLLR